MASSCLQHNRITPLRNARSSTLSRSISNSSPFRNLGFRPTRRISLNRTRILRIRAIDAAQPGDYEALIKDQFERSTKLKIAIVGFGRFGQFLAKTFVKQGHSVLAYNRSGRIDYSVVARKLGVLFFADPHDLCEEHPDVVIICTAITATESVLKALPVQRLRRSTLFVDVLSVKEFPRKLFLQVLPVEFDLLCTHPMFGPDSAKDGWKGLNFMYEKVRIGDEESRVSRCDRFVKIFEQEGCSMVEMSCAEHDRHAAESQFMTHTVGRILEKLKLESTPINTKGFESLLSLVENTSSDSFELYYGLFMYNKNAMEQMERLFMAFESLKQQLFGHLHDVLRKQLFENAEASESSQEKIILPKLLHNGSVVESREAQ